MSEPARVRLCDVTRRFGSAVALDEVSLDIEDGEFVTLLGPSGCGKTTLLRIIGGFDRPTRGTVQLGGIDVTKVPAHRRKVNMVFQRPTMFPHLDVRGNVGFGLRIAKAPRAELSRRVDEALDMVRLQSYGQRKAHELSGGQLQRVALARAIVNQPEVLLLDEPLSALDLTIRLEMEEELRRLHRELGATFVYVTHDQREALALADRIAVFREGRIEQYGRPRDIYHAPATPFVARLVGDSNVVAAAVVPGGVLIGGHQMPASVEEMRGCVWVVVRPENVSLGSGSGPALPGVVIDAAFRGTGNSYRVRVEGIDRPIKAEVTTQHRVGDQVSISWPRDSIRILPRNSEAVHEEG